MRGDFGRSDLFAGSGRNEGDQALAASARVRRTDDADHPDALVSVDRLLDFAREDIKALDEHHVLLAVDEEQEAVLVEVADIARVDEPVADGPGGLFRLIAVARHHVRAPDPHLALLAWREHAKPGVQVDDLYVSARHGLADRAGPDS